MTAQNLVLVDTCIWVQFFNRPRSRDSKAVGELLDEDRAALVGPILTEILLGFRRDEQADWVASMLRGLHLFLPRTERGRDVINESDLRPIASTLDWRKQRQMWAELQRRLEL